jgi:hypothetical protein
MATITITALPSSTTVTDSTYLPVDNAAVTQKITGLSLKTYMTTLPNLVVSGTIGGILTTAAQPNIATLGVLTGVSTTGQIVSTVATGTAPLAIASTTLVANLYTARSAVADATTNGLTTASTFGNTAATDATITGTSSSLSATLVTVNTTPGVWGGNSGSTYYIPRFTLNSKGLITAAGNVVIDLNLASQAVTNLSGTTNQITASGGVGPVVLSLPSQVNITNLTATANIAGAVVYDNSNRVLTSVTVTAGAGMSGGGTVTGPSGTITLTNAGILSVSNGAGLSAVTVSGAVTLTNTGVTGVVGGSGITVSAATGAVTISAASSGNGYGSRYVSSGTPSGGSDGDIWYQV